MAADGSGAKSVKERTRRHEARERRKNRALVSAALTVYKQQARTGKRASDASISSSLNSDRSSSSGGASTERSEAKRYAHAL